MKQEKTFANGTNHGMSRRGFIKAVGTAAAGAGVSTLLPGIFWIDEATAAIPVSEGYLLVDTRKCQGCGSCMLACSLVNEGATDYARARIQVIQNSFAKWPMDVVIAQCRQCAEPACVDACAEGALSVDPSQGNVRRVDKAKCVGCGACAEACPFTPSRAAIMADETYNGEDKARKCDLCAGAPYHWDEAGGGPGGKQACVSICPVKAIKFTAELPEQKGDAGYDVNLRDWKWGMMGFPME